MKSTTEPRCDGHKFFNDVARKLAPKLKCQPKAQRQKLYIIYAMRCYAMRCTILDGWAPAKNARFTVAKGFAGMDADAKSLVG